MFGINIIVASFIITHFYKIYRNFMIETGWTHIVTCVVNTRFEEYKIKKKLLIVYIFTDGEQ